MDLCSRTSFLWGRGGWGCTWGNKVAVLRIRSGWHGGEHIHPSDYRPDGLNWTFIHTSIWTHKSNFKSPRRVVPVQLFSTLAFAFTSFPLVTQKFSVDTITLFYIYISSHLRSPGCPPYEYIDQTYRYSEEIPKHQGRYQNWLPVFQKLDDIFHGRLQQALYKTRSHFCPHLGFDHSMSTSWYFLYSFKLSCRVY